MLEPYELFFVARISYTMLTNEVAYLEQLNWSNERLSLIALQGGVMMNASVLMDGIANSSNDAVLKLLDSCPFIASNHVNARSEFGKRNNTSLILSASKGWNHRSSTQKSKIPHSDIIKKLLEKGANIHDEDIDGRTALHYACLHRDLEAVRFLIQKGALCTQDKNGQTPLDFVFYDEQEALILLQVATGGERNHTFTLNKNHFAPDYNIHLLLLTLLPNADYENVMAIIKKKEQDLSKPVGSKCSQLKTTEAQPKRVSACINDEVQSDLVNTGMFAPSKQTPKNKRSKMESGDLNSFHLHG